MVDKLYCYNADRYIGILSYDREYNEYSFKQEKYGYLEDKAVYDMCLNNSSDAIETSIHERVFPEDRANASELLSSLGMEYYNMWEIFKKINGIALKDTFWVHEKRVNGHWFWENHSLAEYIRSEYNVIMNKYYG